jgi:Tfp pilus assembly protein PilN
MMSINLMPASLREARRCRRARRAWGVALTLAAGVVIPFTLAAPRLAGADVSAIVEQLREVGTQADAADQRRQRLAALEADLARRLTIAEAVAAHPDWSHLLDLLARLRGDDALFDRIDLQRETVTPPAAAQPRTPAQAQPAPILKHTLKLEGLSRSQPAAAGLVLRLEGTGLFESVRLLQTRPDARGKGDAVAFTIECTLRGRDEQAPASTPATSGPRPEAGEGVTP